LPLSKFQPSYYAVLKLQAHKRIYFTVSNKTNTWMLRTYQMTTWR